MFQTAFRVRQSAGAIVLLVGLISLVGCSGVTTGSGPVTPQVSVSVSGAAATRLGSTSQFTATVTGTTNTSVTWQVNGVDGGTAATGTISATGLYTAPATMPLSTMLTITAISQGATPASGILIESLQNPVPVVNSSSAVQIANTLTYTVTVNGSGFVPASSVQVAGSSVITTYISATQLQATVTVATGTTSIAVDVSNPDPGAMLSSIQDCALGYVAASATAAARILDQTSFGPTLSTMQHVQSVGINAYLAEQFAQPTTTLAPIPVTPLPNVCLASNSAYICAESEWWQTALTAPDQLRQRVAFALAEMFVVSTQAIPGQAIPQFHNALANDAFTNFRTIMTDVTLSPAMGGYLNMLNSAAPAAGQIANENYSRENLQLFTTGLYQLNQDGSLQLDGSGNPIPAYSQLQVQAFARAYTGWTLANADGSAVTKFPNPSGDYNDPMVSVAKYHDTTSKTLLNNTVLSAGGTAQSDLTGALDNIFVNTNVGPFVCTQLIQHLVTSTPSPAYVARISAVFADNGSGVRGDMKAVIRAILLDQEARAGDTNASYNGGHLREPILFLTGMMRALNFSNTDVNGAYYYLSNYSAPLGERPYRASSVFNFFPPEYVIPGTTLNAPEFANENSATSILQLTLADQIVNNRISNFTTADLTATGKLGVMAATPATLVDYLSMLLMHSKMPANMRSTIITAITSITNNNAQRARVAVYLVITSSQYKIIH